MQPNRSDGSPWTCACTSRHCSCIWMRAKIITQPTMTLASYSPPMAVILAIVCLQPSPCSHVLALPSDYVGEPCTVPVSSVTTGKLSPQYQACLQPTAGLYEGLYLFNLHFPDMTLKLLCLWSWALCFVNFLWYSWSWADMWAYLDICQPWNDC